MEVESSKENMMVDQWVGRKILELNSSFSLWGASPKMDKVPYSAALIFMATGSRVFGSTISRAWSFMSTPSLLGMMWK